MTDKKAGEKIVPAVEVVGHEILEGDVTEEAEHVNADIDHDVDDFRSEEGTENSDLLVAADKLATKSKGEVRIILNTDTQPKKERVIFDYSVANDWVELYSLIVKNMAKVDADYVNERIDAFRHGLISERDLGVTADSHIKEVVLRLQQKDLQSEGGSSETKANESVSVENRNFDYSAANDWLELFSQIGQRMGSADSFFVIESINAFRAGKITAKELPVTPDSHIRDVVLRLKKKDDLSNEQPSEATVDSKRPVESKSESPSIDNAKNEGESSASPEKEGKHDVRDAKLKGKINKLKIFLDKLNKASNQSDDPLKHDLLTEASLLLGEPILSTSSSDLGSALEQAQVSVRNKILALEIDIKVAQKERLIAPLKKLIDSINSANTWTAKTEVLEEASELLGRSEFDSAVLQHSKEEQELLVPQALNEATVLAESKIKSIEDETSILKNSIISEKVSSSESVLTGEPNPNPEPSPTIEPEPIIPEDIEKDLGYLDIDPKAILGKLTAKDLETLHTLMNSGNSDKINAFYQAKIQEVLVDQKKDKGASEELIKQMAEAINNIIQQKIQREAEVALLKKGFKGKGVVLGKIGLNVGIMVGTSALIGSLGIATGGLGVLVGAAGVTGVRLLLRNIEKNRQKKRSEDKDAVAEDRDLQLINLMEKKDEIVNAIFSPDNLEHLRAELSGHIANTLREQTSGRALKALRDYEQADDAKEPEIAGAKLREVEKQLYFNALTKVRAEHPEVTPEQQQNMALTLALTLGQHERNENLAKQRLEEIKKSKPALYKLIEKYNLLNAGDSDKKPAGMSKEEESLWDKSKYNLLALGIGTAVGYGVRTSRIGQVAMGAVAGAGLGYMAGQWMENRDEKKAFAEISKMVNESEKLINDTEFPISAIDKLRKDSIFVKSKLDLGLLDNDPLLKSRAENFIHQVQKIELAVQGSYKKLLDSISERTDQRAQQVEDDLDRIGSKIKNRRQWATIGGAVVGGALAWVAGEFIHKKEVNHDQAGINNAEAPADSTLGAEQPIAAEQTPEISLVSEVQKNGGVWKAAEAKLEELFGHDKWESFGEAKQTHMIDELKDQVAANPEAYGIHHDIDSMQVGERIDWSPSLAKPDALDSLLNHANTHSAADLQNILDNNAALRESGVRLTQENVDSVINEVRNHGTDFLTKDGSIHEWAFNGQAVDRLDDGSFVLAGSHDAISPDQLAGVLNHAKESAQHLVDTELAAKAAAEAAATKASEVAAEAAAQAQVESFLVQGGQYDHTLYEAAKNSGNLDQLVDKIISGDSQTQAGALVYDFARDHGWSADKANVFLGALRNGDKIDLAVPGSSLHGVQALLDNMKAFENAALDSFDKVKGMPSDHWMPVRMGEDYALVQKVHSGVWPLRSDHFLMDNTGNHTIDVTLDDHAMRQTFEGDHRVSSQPAEIVNRSAAQSVETGTREAGGVLSNADSSFVELAKNSGAIDSFIDNSLNPEERVASLASRLPEGQLTDFNGITLSQQNGSLLWHMGNQTPLPVDSGNIDHLAALMKIVRDQVGTTMPSNWESQISNTFEQALGKK